MSIQATLHMTFPSSQTIGEYIETSPIIHCLRYNRQVPRLQLDRSSTIEVYIPYLKTLYERHRILPRAQDIEAQLHATKDTHRRIELQVQFNALDLERIRYIKYTDKNTNRLNRSNMLGLPLLIKLAAQSATGKLEGR